MGFVSKAVFRPLALAGALGLGLAMFVRPWPITPLSQRQNRTQFKLAADLEHNKLYHAITTDKSYKLLDGAALMPDAHRTNHVGQGLLKGPGHLDVGPLVYVSKSQGSMVAFARLGPGLAGDDGKVHNGIVSTLLDELLCLCGFPTLPSKRGVTASLDIDFAAKAEPGSVVVVKGKVVSHKGRKCVIEGDVADLRGKPIASARCVLVEPKWFKYFAWVDLF